MFKKYLEIKKVNREKFKFEREKFKTDYKKLLESDSKERYNYTVLGKDSITSSLFLILFIFLGGIQLGTNPIIFITIHIIFLLILSPFCVYGSLYFIILQRKLNNKPIFYLAVIIYLISLSYYSYILHLVISNLLYAF